MGFFSEIKKFFSKTTEEFLRPASSKSGGIGSILKAPKIPVPPAPTPIAPPPTRVSGGASDEIRRRQRGRVSGRRKTIVTGELSPTQTGKKTLLGR